MRTAKTLGLGGVPALGLKKLVSIENSPPSSQEEFVPVAAGNSPLEEPPAPRVESPDSRPKVTSIPRLSHHHMKQALGEEPEVNVESSCGSVRSTSRLLPSGSRNMRLQESSADRESQEISAPRAESPSSLKSKATLSSCGSVRSTSRLLPSGSRNLHLQEGSAGRESQELSAPRAESPSSLKLKATLSSCGSVRSTSRLLPSGSRNLHLQEGSAGRESQELPAPRAESPSSLKSKATLVPIPSQLPIKEKPVDKRRKCPVCHQKFHRGHYNRHVKSHTAAKVKCDLCKVSLTSDYLPTHQAKFCPRYYPHA